MRAHPLAAAALCVALAGCGAGAARPEAPRLLPPLSHADVRRIVAEVAAVRGLPERAPIPIALLDARGFAGALRARMTAEPDAGDLERDAGFLVAFNLMPALGHGPQRPSTMREVLEEQIAAFYDFEERRVFVQAAPARSEDEALEQRGVLAHEIQHALQAQHFAVPDLDALPSEESRLSQLAVLEGDAMVAMAAYIAADKGAPVGRVLRRVSELAHTVPFEELAQGERHAALRNALPIARERLLFPYIAGMGFVADLYRAGGFPLVNHLFARPPASTEQVLHPEKYLAGEPPIEVRAPEPPAGYRLIGSEPMGELQTRVILERCVQPAEAKAASEGWGGDRFGLAAAPDRSVALLWSTAWDSPLDAAEFEAALRRNPRCWDPSSLVEGGGGWRVAGPIVALRDRHRVAVVRGLAEPLAQDAARRLLALPAPAGAAAPVGAFNVGRDSAFAGPFQIPPRLPIPEAYRGVVQGDVYQSGWLGVAGRIPAGVPATTRDADLELKLGRDDVLVVGGLAVSDRVTTPRFVEKLFQELAQGFASELEAELVVTGGGASQHPLGPAIERTWILSGTTVELRAVVVPVCGGTGSYVFVQTWAEPYARSVLESWAGSFRWLGPGRPPVCEALDPR